MPMGCYNKRPEETSDDFFVRIGNAVLARELTWDGAAKVLNDELGKNFGECAYRKRFKAFRAGMQYQESLSNRDVGTCILSISDLHIPFQKPIETFGEYAGKIDILQVNGDLVDAQAISRFNKVYRKSPMEEILIARQYMIPYHRLKGRFYAPIAQLGRAAVSKTVCFLFNSGWMCQKKWSPIRGWRQV